MPFWRENIDINFAIKPTVIRLKEDSVIVDNERIVLTLESETYGVPIILEEKERGIVFFGRGDYLVNSKIKTYVGTYSKQYIDNFNGWGCIIGRFEKWSDICKSFTETSKLPRGFGTQEEFIKKADKELNKIIRRSESKSIGNTDWFFSANGEKGKATFHYQRGKIVFNGCNANLVSRNEEQVVLNEGDVKLVLRGKNVVLKSSKGKMVSSGENIAFDSNVVSGDKIVSENFIGRNKKKVEEIKARASSLFPMLLEDLGYQLEK